MQKGLAWQVFTQAESCLPMTAGDRALEVEYGQTAEGLTK